MTHKNPGHETRPRKMRSMSVHKKHYPIQLELWIGKISPSFVKVRDINSDRFSRKFAIIDTSFRVQYHRNSWHFMVIHGNSRQRHSLHLKCNISAVCLINANILLTDGRSRQSLSKSMIYPEFPWNFSNYFLSSIINSGWKTMKDHEKPSELISQTFVNFREISWKLRERS